MNGLKVKAIEAFKWSVVGKLVAQTFTWASTIIVIRFLSPLDYSLMAKVEVVFALLYVFSISGFSENLIKKVNLRSEDKREIFGLLILINFIIAAIQVLSAPFVADYFNEPQISEILIILSIIFIISPWIIIPSCLLSRELDFKKKVIVDMLAVLASSAVSLVMAMNNFGVWSLVVGMLVINAIKVVGYNVLKPINFLPAFRMNNFREFFSFGIVVAFSGIIWTLYMKVDIIIGGHFLSPESIGIYAVAMHLALMPMVKIMPIINQVAFPLYSAVQSDLEKLRSTITKSIRLSSIMVFPLFFGLYAISGKVIPLILGDTWESAALPFGILCLTIPFRMVLNLFSPALKATGKQMVNLYNSLIILLFVSTFIFFSVEEGILGMSIAWLLVTPIIFLSTTFLSCRALGLSVLPVFQELKKPVIGSLFMLVVLKFVEPVLEVYLGGISVVLLMILTGVSFYGLYVLFFCKELVLEFNDLFIK